jgi:hypothetical protein
MSFWWQSFSDANWTAFDCGMEKFLNRYTLFVEDGEEGPELVFRSCGGNLEGRAAEIFVPLERIGYRPGQWYHIMVSARGEDPALMELFIDGVAMGERRGLTYLNSNLQPGDSEISVENADGFPAIGALMIGDEVVEYETRGAEAFQDCWRGARGTHDAQLGPGNGRDWPKGTPVRQLGYSSILIEDIMAGGASLPATLGRWSAVAVMNGRDESSTTLQITDAGDPDTEGDEQVWTYWGIPDTDEVVTLEIQALWGEETLGNSFADAFGTSGIALLGGQHHAGSVGIPNPPAGEDGGAPLSGADFVYYTRTSGDNQTIQIEKRFLEREPWTQATPYFLPTRVHYVGNGLDIRVNLHAYLIPLSIEGMGSGQIGDDYFNPKDAIHKSQLQRFPLDHDANGSADEGDGSARVLIGLPDENADPPVLSECIRYDSIDRETSTLGATYFVADRLFVARIGNHFFPNITFQAEEEPEDDVVDEGVVEEDVQEDTTGGEEDIDPPGDEVVPPDTEPEPDTSGGGDSEAPDEGDEVPDNLIEMFADPLAQLPDLPDAQALDATDDTAVPHPDWRGAKLIVHRFFRGNTATYNQSDNLWSGEVDRLHEAGGSSGSDRGMMILPCFRVWAGPRFSGALDATNDQVPGRPLLAAMARPAGRNDLVTISDGQDEAPQRYKTRIRWAARDRQYVALDEFLDVRVPGITDDVYQEWRTERGAFARDWADPRGQPRILRVPTGELPEELPNEIEFGASTISNRGAVTAYMDELHIFRHPVNTAPLLRINVEEGLTEETNEIRIAVWPSRDTIDGVSGHHDQCGIVSFDGELIAFRSVRTEGSGVFVLEDCERGVLGSETRPHPNGSIGRFVTDFPVTCLRGNVTRDSNSISVAQLDSTWPTKGLLRILSGNNIELIHYTHRTKEAFELPEALDADENVRGRGLLRGRFGTDVTEHDDGDLVFYQPFRYWDRYIPRRTEEDEGFSGIHDHPEAAYLEIGQRFRSGYWHRVTWKEDLLGRRSGEDDEREESGDGSGYLDILVLVRLNPSVPWDSENVIDLRGGEEMAYNPQSTERSPDKLYLLDDPEAANRLGLESESLEMRIYFTFRPGAFTPLDVAYGQAALGDDLLYENAWKASPWLREVSIEYTSQTTTLGRSSRR